MSYSFYLGALRLPVAPARLDIKYNNKLKRIDLASGKEIVFPKSEGLAEISFGVLLPQIKYPFAVYNDKFCRGGMILLKLMSLKESGKPFRFIVLRNTPGGSPLVPTNIKTVFSQISSREDAKEGLDIYVDIKLVEYRDFAVKNVKPTLGGGSGESGTSVVSGAVYGGSGASNPTATYTVVHGDSLWMIAHKFLGDGNRCKELYNINKAVIDAGNRGTGNPVYTIYPGQVLKLK